LSSPLRRCAAAPAARLTAAAAPGPQAAAKTGFNLTSWLALVRMHSLSARREDLAACLAAAAEVVQFHLGAAGPRAQQRAIAPQVCVCVGGGRPVCV
jgi:hypothetical protein